jgi:hypothetical protein
MTALEACSRRRPTLMVTGSPPSTTSQWLTTRYLIASAHRDAGPEVAGEFVTCGLLWPPHRPSDTTGYINRAFVVGSELGAVKIEFAPSTSRENAPSVEVDRPSRFSTNCA